MNSMRAFKQRSQNAIANPLLQVALDNNAARRAASRVVAFDSLPNSTQVRTQARQIRQDVISNLDRYLGEFIDNVESNGIIVHNTATSEEAAQSVVSICQDHNANRVVKSKSILTEEIELNRALESNNIQPVETDLGELIVQLRGERPTHITTPAVHLNREQIAKTFETQLGMPFTTDVEKMNAAAREYLRDIFLNTKVGISGVNFGVADAGTLCIIENEGNIRMATTLPPVHIAVMGMERLVPSYSDLSVMLQVLARSGTGQKLTSYMSFINSARLDNEPDGALERHLVLVDNNRLSLSSSVFSESLLCIRCGACLNACPVYQEIGGESYQSAYPGPIGSVLSPGLFGQQDFGQLASASTLCGACVDACPVAIDFPKLLQRTRKEFVQEVKQPLWKSIFMRMYAKIQSKPQRLIFSQKTLAVISRLLPKKGGWLSWLPQPFGAWTSVRHFPLFSRKSFRQRWAEMAPTASANLPITQVANYPPSTDSSNTRTVSLLDQFDGELNGLGAALISCSQENLPMQINDLLTDHHISSVLVSPFETLGLETILSYLEDNGVDLVDPDLQDGESTQHELLSIFANVPAGLTRSVAGLADTGTIIQPNGVGRSQLASLLPPLHIAILFGEDLFPNMQTWLQAGGGAVLQASSSLSMITGPSRTADIEMTLTIGVHGPAKLYVICVI